MTKHIRLYQPIFSEYLFNIFPGEPPDDSWLPKPLPYT